MKYCLFILSLFFVAGVSAQEHMLRGFVTDETGAALKGVGITITGNKKAGTSSEINGGFSLSCSPGDTLNFSHIGFETFKTRIQADQLQKKSHPLIIQLVPRFIPLKQVTIMEKRDMSFQYLLDFELVNGSLLKLEIRGRNKLLILSDTNGKEYWRCMLPGYMRSCNKLGRDFRDSLYLQSDDSLYQLSLNSRMCQLWPAVYQSMYHQIMDQCIGNTSNGILIRNYGEYNKSVTVWVTNRSGRKKIYEQEDKLALKYCRDLMGDQNPNKPSQSISDQGTDKTLSGRGSEFQQRFARGDPGMFACKIMAKPIKVELFCINDSIFVFDNTENRMFIYAVDCKLIKSNQIDFNTHDFLCKFIIDDRTKMVYGVFKNKQGIYLQLINRETGRLSGPAKCIDMYFFEKVRICDNKVIYLKYDHTANTRSIVKTYL